MICKKCREEFHEFHIDETPYKTCRKCRKILKQKRDIRKTKPKRVLSICERINNWIMAFA